MRCVYIALLTVLAVAQLAAGFDIPYTRVTDVPRDPSLYHFGQNAVPFKDQNTFVCRIIGILPTAKKLTMESCFIAGRTTLSMLANSTSAKIIAAVHLTNGLDGCVSPGNFPLLVSVYAGQTLGIFTWDLQSQINCIAKYESAIYNWNNDYWKVRHCSDFPVYAARYISQNKSALVSGLQNELNLCTSRQVWNEVKNLGSEAANGAMLDKAVAIAKAIMGKIPEVGGTAVELWEFSEKIAAFMEKDELEKQANAATRVQQAVAMYYIEGTMLILSYVEKANSMMSGALGSNVGLPKKKGGAGSTTFATKDAVMVAVAKAQSDMLKNTVQNSAVSKDDGMMAVLMKSDLKNSIGNKNQRAKNGNSEESRLAMNTLKKKAGKGAAARTAETMVA